MIVLMFAWAGDMTSYHLGKRYGPRLTRRFLHRAKRRRVWRKAKNALQLHGARFVVIARLLGPVSWVTPFLAGTLGMERRRFAPAAALGVAIGVGLFLLYGAVGQQLLDVIFPFIWDHVTAIALGLGMTTSSILVWKHSQSPGWSKMLKAGTVSVAIFLATNVSYFFVLDTHTAEAAPQKKTVDVCQAISGPYQVSAGDTSLHLPQPINVILFSGETGADMMQNLSWHQNMTFTHNEIGFFTYLKSLIQLTPPVSELYLEGRPADSAFQLPGTLKDREHIRWWNRGGGIHFGAISRDDEIAIKYYGQLPVILHDIDPNVDVSRQLLAEQIARTYGYSVVGTLPLARAVPEGSNTDYVTDGGILVLKKDGQSISDELEVCLNSHPQWKDNVVASIAQSS